MVTVELTDGPARFHALWLRDNAQDGVSRHNNDQRLFDVTDLAEVVTVVAAEVVDGRLIVEFGPDGVVSSWNAGWLETHCYDLTGGPRVSGQSVNPWTADGLGGGTGPRRLAWVDSDNPVAWADTTRALQRDGVIIVDGLDTGRTSASIGDVAALWGPIRETNYGRVFHVRAEVNPNNLAFTPRALNVHTDNPYRRPVPGYQLLHCLVASAVGGVTVLVDGFRAAEALRDEDPAAFSLLSTRSVPFRWSGEGFDLRNRGPLIEVVDGGPVHGIIRAVRYNNRSLAPFDLSFDEMSEYYRAFRTFARLLHRPELEYRFTLEPGECMVFDNERILHGRDGEADPERYLQGCYLDRDWIHGRIVDK